MDYSNMDRAAAAAELIRGKRVAVVGSAKLAFDTVAECANANGARYLCAMICRSGRWMVNGGFVWGVSLGHLFSNCLAKLMVCKPGEGLALTLLAMLLTPLRWLLSKLAETYYKMQIPMEKHGMVPEESFAGSMSGCRLGVLPDGFYDRVEEGSILIKRTRSFSFCTDGLVLDDTGERVEADVVVLATGFHGEQKLRDMFVSATFKQMVAADTPAPLYRCACRQCIHPRIPQMAVIGYTENLSSIYTFEMMAKWVAHLLAGAFRLPSVRRMEASAAEWDEHLVKRHGEGGCLDKPCLGAVSTWYNEELSRGGSKILAEWLRPYGPADFAGIL